MRTREDQKQRIQQATDIVRLIGEQVALRPKGSEHVGLCPFHDDRSPSFHVSPAKQIYKCFSCGAGGDVFSFVVNYHRMTFPEALRYLAERAGIELETPTSSDRARSDQRQRLAEANQNALDFYRAQLKHPDAGRTARNYIEQRGIHPDMVAAFQLGYAPNAWDALAQEVARRKWDVRGFLGAGLIAERNRGDAVSSHAEAPDARHCYDRLRHRLIFPIFDAIGRPIAFGGRVLAGGTLNDPTADAKYLNSPENALFNKSATLYGIHLAKKPIIDARSAVIVEGYTDVIACHQAGAKNVVATLGTALTVEHVRELRRYAERVVLVFDADAAGQKAADRAVELFMGGEVDVAIAVLPEGLDPADLLAEEDGYERWVDLVERAGDALSYQFQRISEQLSASQSMSGREQVVQGYLTRLAQLGLLRTSPIRRALVIQRLASLLRVSETVVNDLLSRAGTRAGRVGRSAAGGSSAAPQAGIEDSYADAQAMEAGGGDVAADVPGDVSDDVGSDVAFMEEGPRLKAVRQAERQLIGCLLRDNSLFHHTLDDGRSLDEAMAPADMVTPDAQALYRCVYQQLSEGIAVSLAPLLSELVAGHTSDPPSPASANVTGVAGVSLTDLATEADAEVDRATCGDSQRLAELCASAASAILRYHSDREYVAGKRQLQGIDDEQEKLRRAAQLIESRRMPAPARIARPPVS